MVDSELEKPFLKLLQEGLVIPAHPLALTERHELDEQKQRALTRYYLSAGAGGLAVGVHTTQFAIRYTTPPLLEPVLRLAMETAREFRQGGCAEPVMIAGICGTTQQAVAEAELARSLGYHAGLLSLGGLSDWSDHRLLEHARVIADILPVVGFYLQPAVGGRVLKFGFWREFAEIKNVVAIKVAPFNRYQSWDVIRAVGECSRWNEIALYTGNDDNIVFDMLARFRVQVGGEQRRAKELRDVPASTNHARYAVR